MTRARILFIAEAVTLAQVVRLVQLARSLDTQRYEIHFASAAFHPLIFANCPWHRWPIRSRSPEAVERDAARGWRIFNLETLRRYVQDEEELFAAVKPNLVVSDLRWSVAISAPRAHVHHMALINAYWRRQPAQSWPLPDHPIIGLVGEALAAEHYPRALPYVLAHHAAPFNALRRHYGLPQVKSLPDVLTCADTVLYPDTPMLAPTASVGHHHYLGPVLWAPALPRPTWVKRRDKRRKLVYVTLGSSGRVDVMPQILQGLSHLPIDVAVATAGRVDVKPAPNRHVADYLPGDVMAKEAAMVVCNGGSTTAYQALAAGCPVLGVPTNLDQCLSMQAIAATGAGTSLPARRASAHEVTRAVQALLGGSAYTVAAQNVAQDMRQHDAGRAFAAHVAAQVS